VEYASKPLVDCRCTGALPVDDEREIGIAYAYALGDFALADSAVENRACQVNVLSVLAHYGTENTPVRNASQIFL